MEKRFVLCVRMEDLLTEFEINEILEEAKNPRYSDPRTIHIGKCKTCIFKLSRKSGLILVYGNKDTGYKHILNRHSQWSRKAYWKEGKLDNPTKFELGLAPIEYLSVAEGIFKNENIVDEKNARKDIFDVFIGKHKRGDSREIEYRLVNYKGTGIMHSLFINENNKPFNDSRRPIINLVRSFPTKGQYDYKNGIYHFECVYSNLEGIELYKVIVQSLVVEQVQKWYIQVNDSGGKEIRKALIKVEPIIQRLDFPFFHMKFAFENLSWVEKVIKEMIDGEFDFEKLPKGCV